MSWTPGISAEDLTLYAMGLLSDAERLTLENQLQRSPEAREELARIHGDLALYAMSSEMQSPPAQARQRLMKAVGREKRTAPVERMDRNMDFAERVDRNNEFAERRDRMAMNRNEDAPLASRGEDRSTFSSYGGGAAAGAFYEPGASSNTTLHDEPVKRSGVAASMAWAGWAIAAGLGFFAFSLHQQQRGLQTTLASRDTRIKELSVEAAKAQEVLDAMNDRTNQEITLTKVGLGAPPDPTGRASYSPAHGTVFFIANNLEQVDPAKVYELWIIPADGRDPIPSGTFRPDAKGNVSMITQELPKGVVAKAFGLTIEGEGGSTKPTLPIVMVGA